MTSLPEYQLRVMQLHTTLSRINRDMLDYLFKISLVGKQSKPGPTLAGEDPLLMHLVKFRENLMESDADLLWMNCLCELETRMPLTNYHPESLLYYFRNKSFKKSVLRYLHTAHDVLLGLALHLSGTTEAGKDNSGLGSIKINLLNREDANVLLVLEVVRDIKLCIDLINEPKSKVKKG